MLCFFIALAVALPVLALLAFSYLQTHDRVRRDLELVARASVAHSEKLLTRVHEHLRKLVANGNVSCSQADRAVYTKVIYDNIELRGIGVMDGKARLFECSDLEIFTPPLQMTREDDWAVGPPGEIAVISPRPDLQGQLSIFVNYGFGDGRIIDAVIYPQQFWDFQQSLNLGEGGAVVLLDGKGRALTALGSENFSVPSEGGVRSDGFARYGNLFAASARSTRYPIEAVTIVSFDRVMADWRRTALTFAPLALLVTAMASLGVWRFGMRARPLSDMLLDAIDKGELYLVYQPIIELRTGRISAVEALCRWTHPELGEVRPDQFVDAATRDGILPALSAWVFRTAAQELRPLMQRESDFRVSLNVGRDDLKVDGPLSKAMLESRDVLSRVIFEVTERDPLAEVLPTALEALSSWREMGVKIALDDFGTGCCNLSYLRLLPIDIVKIDRMFAATIDDINHQEDNEILDAVLTLMRTRKVELIIEGIERREQHEQVRARDIHFAQGWFYAKGMTLNALEIWLSHHTQSLQGA